MATGTTLGGFRWAGIDSLRQHWAWFLALGICLVVLGTIALSYSVAATLASVIVFGWLLIVGGALQAVHALWRKHWGALFIDLFTGILYLAAGAIPLANPVLGAATLTIVIAVFLWIGGVTRIVAALAVRHHHWGWLLLSGIINVLLGFLIWQQWPFSGLWVIGLFVGIDMLFNGWSLVMLGLIARRLPQPHIAPSHNWMASCLIALGRATRENGCLQVLKGSQHMGRVEHGRFGKRRRSSTRRGTNPDA